MCYEPQSYRREHGDREQSKQALAKSSKDTKKSEDKQQETEGLQPAGAR